MSNKTETTPKTESTHTTASNPFASFDPMSTWVAGQQAFHKMMMDAYGRAQSFVDEYAALEAQMIGRAQGAVDSWAQLAHDAIAYSAQLSAQARKLGFETARKFGAVA